MAERIFEKQTAFGPSRIHINTDTKKIANPAFKFAIDLCQTGARTTVEYMDELKQKGYEEVTR